MKRQQLVELHKKSVNQLKELAKKTQQELVKLRTDLGAGKLKDVHQIKFKRRDLARIKTILGEKELLKPNEKLQSPFRRNLAQRAKRKRSKSAK